MQFIKTVSLMSFMPEVINITGVPVPAAGFYGPTAGNHTIQITTSNFIGALFIEGTLDANPSNETHWFPIFLNGKIGILFSDVMNRPNLDLQIIGFMGQTTTIGYNFTVNCNYLRARVVRDYVIPVGSNPAQIGNYGQIDSIIVAY